MYRLFKIALFYATKFKLLRELELKNFLNTQINFYLLTKKEFKVVI